MVVLMDIKVSGVKPITFPVRYRYKEEDYGYYCTKDEEHPVFRYDNYCSVCGSVVLHDKDKVVELENLPKTLTVTELVYLVNIMYDQDDLTTQDDCNYHTYIDYDKLDKELTNNLDKVIDIFKEYDQTLNANDWILHHFGGGYRVNLPKVDYYSVNDLIDDIPIAIKKVKSTMKSRSKDAVALLKMFFDKVDITFRVSV